MQRRSTYVNPISNTRAGRFTGTSTTTEDSIMKKNVSTTDQPTDAFADAIRRSFTGESEPAIPAPEETAPHERKGLFRRLASSRKGRIGLGFGALFVAVGTTAAAAALYAVLAGITGGGSSGTITAAFTSATVDTANTTVAYTGSPTVTSGKLALPTGKFWPQDTLVLNTSITTTGTGGKVTGIVMPGLPTGWTASIDAASCGGLVEAGKTLPVKVTITMPGSAAPTGASWTLGAAAGVQVSPASQVTTTPTCTTYTAS